MTNVWRRSVVSTPGAIALSYPLGLGLGLRQSFQPHFFHESSITIGGYKSAIAPPPQTELHEWSENAVNVENRQFLRENCEFLLVIWIKWKWPVCSITLLYSSTFYSLFLPFFVLEIFKFKYDKVFVRHSASISKFEWFEQPCPCTHTRHTQLVPEISQLFLSVLILIIGRGFLFLCEYLATDFTTYLIFFPSRLHKSIHYITY